MPDIKPFRGIFYNLSKIELAKVVAPPYDVIFPEQQAELYEQSPYNVVRLILGREENRYQSAAAYFQQWRSEKVLIADEVPALYILSQTFSLPDERTVERRGFIAACKLEEFGQGTIFPHEKTLSKPKDDRFKLFMATHAMFSQIFSLYSDPNGIVNRIVEPVMNETPFCDVEFEGVKSRLWKLIESGKILTLAEFLKRQKVLIADGHHRYETALLYRDAQRLTNPNHTGKEPYNFVPMFFTNMSDPGLVVFPTHRLIRSLPGFDAQKLLKDLKTFFDINNQLDATELLNQLHRHSMHAFGLVVTQAPHFFLLTLKHQPPIRSAAAPELVMQLDVYLLHKLILKDLLHILDEQQEKNFYLEFERDELQAIQRVMQGQAQAVFLMNPTRVEQVRRVAEAGFTLPQKSTYFHPKLLSGLVNYSFVKLSSE
ncbi:MAG: DUF1015 domain-containing protein [Ignavibacteriae bacterium]|nr:DUF1015 domain-containing protein [Ignavibacteriota bacterium]